MKKTLILLIILISLITSTGAVLASDISDALFYGIVRASNNSTLAQNVSAVVSINSTAWINNSTMNSTATDVVIRNNSGADTTFMPGYDDDVWSVWYNAVPENGNVDATLYTNSSDGKIRYFPGDAGMETVESASLELGEDSTINMTGYIQTTFTDNYTDRNLFNKDDAFNISVKSSGTINATILTQDRGWVTPTGFVDSSGDWSNETNAFDNNTGTFSQGQDEGGAFGNFLELTHAGLWCNNIRIWTSKDAARPQADLDAYYNGQWNHIYQGTDWNNGAWTEKPLDATFFVTALRFRQYSDGNDAVLNEADFFEPEEIVSVSATNVASGEHEVVVTTGTFNDADVSDTTTFAADFGAGMIPVKRLARIELTADASSVNFAGIDDLVAEWDIQSSTTSRHLVLMVNAWTTAAVAHDAVITQFNTDTGNTYNRQRLVGDDTTDTASRETDTSSINLFFIPGTSYTNASGGGIVLIPHAFNTSNHKATLSIGGASEDTVIAVSGRWEGTDAIASILFELFTSNDFTAGSVFVLGVVDERFLIAEDLPSGTNVTFAGIAGTGDDLCAIGYGRTDRASTTDPILHEINNDSTAGNYFQQTFEGAGTATTAAAANNNRISIMAGATADVNAFGGMVAFYSSYAEGANDPHYISINGVHSTGASSYIRLHSGRRNNVAAITQLEFIAENGAGFDSGSLFSLYRVPRNVIAKIELITTADNVTFSNIPDYYEAIKFNIYARGIAAASTDNITIQINNDATVANYDFQNLSGIAGVITADRNLATQTVMEIPAASEGANEFGGGQILLPGYAENDSHKHLMVFEGIGGNQIYIRSGRWESTDPIDKVVLYPSSGNFTSETIIELIGLMPKEAFYISIDGIIQDLEIVKLITDNSNNITSCQNNSIPYLELQQITTGGTLQQSIAWEYATTFTDLSGNGHDATPTFRSVSSDLDVTAELINFAPISLAQVSDDSATGWGEIIEDPPDEPETTFTEDARPGFFFEPLVHTFWALSGLPDSFFWYNFAFIIIIFGGMISYYLTADKKDSALLIKCVVMTGLMIFFALPGLNVFGFYVAVYFILYCFGILILARNFGW